MKTRSKAAIRLLTTLQGMTIVIMALGTCFAVVLGMMGAASCVACVEYPRPALIISTVTGYGTLITVSVSCYIALTTFLLICHRLKRERAFTKANSRSLLRISRCCLVSGAALLIALIVFEALFCTTPDCPPVNLPALYLFVLMLLFAGVGVICQVLQVLLDDAIALQDESDLTV